MEFTIQELQIAGLCCSLYLPPAYHENEECYPTLYVNGEIPLKRMLTALGGFVLQNERQIGKRHNQARHPHAQAIKLPLKARNG